MWSDSIVGKDKLIRFLFPIKFHDLYFFSLFAIFLSQYLFLLLNNSFFLQVKMEHLRLVRLQAGGSEPVSPKSTWSFSEWLLAWTHTLALVSEKVYLKPQASQSHEFR